MTESEAIKLLEYIRETGNGEAPYVGCAQNIAIEMAINALEKQIPKKPKKSQSKLRYLGTYMCPSCGGDFSGTGVASYCYHCGQRFKWNDAEEVLIIK